MAAVFSSKNAHRSSVWLVSHHQPPGAAAYNREADMGQHTAFVKGRAGLGEESLSFLTGILWALAERWATEHDTAMSPPLIVALAIIAFAAAFHLHWALGGRLGYSVSLPQRPDGVPVMDHRIGWWRPAAGAVAFALALLAGLALAAEGHLGLPLPPALVKGALALAGAAFVLRAIVPTRWTGFFKRIRTTRWARYDSLLYSPLFLLLGGALLVIAFR
jgi:hypothetical protein